MCDMASHICVVFASTHGCRQLEELPGGYQTKSLMALPVMLPRDASGAAALTAAQNAAAAEAVHAREHAVAALALHSQSGGGNGSQPGYPQAQPSPTRQQQAASTGSTIPQGGFILGSQGQNTGHAQSTVSYSRVRPTETQPACMLV
jgi:hypothetical protein